MSKLISASSVLALSELFNELSEESAKLAILVKENPGAGFRQARQMQDDFDDLLGEIDEILFSDSEGFLGDDFLTANASTEEKAEGERLDQIADEELNAFLNGPIGDDVEEWSCPF